MRVDFDSPVGWLALWGATLATANTIVALLKHWRERGKLQVTAIVGEAVDLGGGLSQRTAEAEIVAVTIVNIGAKPVHFAQIGAEHEFAGQKSGVAVMPLPKEKLEPGESLTTAVMKVTGLRPGLRWLGAKDTLGRVWSVPKGTLARLVREEEERRASNVDAMTR